MRRKYIFLTLIIFLLISIIINVALFKQNIICFRQNKILQIDPLNLLYFYETNNRFKKHTGNKIKIVLFGDSRISQWDPVPLIPGCEIINRGIPGDTTSRSLLRIENDLLLLKPDIAIIQIGINDCNSIGVLPELEKYIIVNCKNNITQIMNILNKSKIRTLFLTIFPPSSVPLYRLPFWSEKTRDYINEINSILFQPNAKYIRIVNCDEIFFENNKMKNNYSRDLLHINRKAYIRLNDYIRPYLEKYITEINQRN
jgi:lysophospholipase L1-like esterase